MIDVGASAQRTFRFDADAVEAFAALTSDRAPVHFDDAQARAMGFDRRIVHGLLVGSVFSEMLGCQIPGPASVIQKLSLDLLSPVYVGSEVSYRVEVTRTSAAVKAVSLALTATDDGGVLVCRGQAVCVMRRDE